MSELPRTDDLPRTEEGYDPLRVEEAFASFGDRVRELESIAAELRAELRSLRAERAAVYAAPETDPDWPADDGVGAPLDWVAAAIPPPLQQRFTVPRLALEALFLLLVALFAGLADLAPAWIALLMAGAWVVVVLVEWTAAARRARWRLDEIPPPLEPAADVTGRWSSPVVEATAFAAPDVSESRTVVAKLPADPEVAEADPEDTAETEEPEPEPEPRRGLLRRGRVETAASVTERAAEPEVTEAVPDDAAAAAAPEPAPEAEAEQAEEQEPAPQPEAEHAEEQEPEEEQRRGLFRRRGAETPAPVLTLPIDSEAAEGPLKGTAEPETEAPGEEPRRGFFRRRKPQAPAPADPWET